MFYLQCNLMCLHQFQKEEKDLGFICDYYCFTFLCCGNCVRMKNEVSVVLLSCVQSEALETETHTDIQSPFISLGRTLHSPL